MLSDQSNYSVIKRLSLFGIRQKGSVDVVESIVFPSKANFDLGRGVFTQKAIPAGTVIETCPVLIFPKNDLEHLRRTFVDHYSYNWPIADPVTGKTVTTQALSLGLGSIFNHSRDQNVGFSRDLERELIVYKTLRQIEAGEELCISYGSHLWFEDADGSIEDIDIIKEEQSLLQEIQIDAI